ncbi:hypothetical protein E3Q22_03735 [Wallemia mellicola]|uniref:Uncharacterized protein n=1 Tax=Wallemia mellicola TaxID=1708541 RepID=A0A4T0M0S6_9BASI|nr:hypothetical protein E3Q22_03735 [Wallemia mellicola]TIC08889.1 hypothetical protein E3Q14_03715 [Wallemia mellicola]TIC25615.1 hypothetical protein E3Q10_03700 [Wallemia mellicola]TIC47857.1 hypothetical protein E3Q05_04357 [Wallemia mellicola]TIC63152.1 hypothetical protein E3Q01_03542 [Wallemia mellicola]
MSSAEPENKKRRRMQSENEKENNKDNSPTNSFADHSAPRGGRAFAIEVDKAVNERMAEKDKEFDRSECKHFIVSTMPTNEKKI